MKSGCRIACIGEGMIELSGWDKATGKASIGYAGDVVNTSIYLSRLLAGGSEQVSFVSALGTDNFSDDMVASWQAEGVDCSLIVRDPDRLPGLYAIETDEHGERSFSYWRSNSAARQMFGTAGLDIEKLVDFDALYLSGITLAILPEEGKKKLIDLAANFKRQGRHVFFDSNYRPRLWASADEARLWLQKMLEQSTIALPSEDDEAMLYPDGALFERLVRFGLKEFVIKRGTREPLLYADGNLTPVQTSPATRMVDATGAGDSFNAGYVAGRLRGLDLISCVHLGHALASKVVGYRGAIIPKDDFAGLAFDQLEVGH